MYGYRHDVDFQAQEDLSKQLQVMKAMLFGAESAAASGSGGPNPDQQSDIALAQLSQVWKLFWLNMLMTEDFFISLSLSLSLSDFPMGKAFLEVKFFSKVHKKDLIEP